MTREDVMMSNGLLIGTDLDQIGTNLFTSLAFKHASPGGGLYASPVVVGSGEDTPYNDDAVTLSNKLYLSRSRRPWEIFALDRGSRLVETSLAGNRMRFMRSMPRSEVRDVSVLWAEVTAPSKGFSVLAQ